MVFFFFSSEIVKNKTSCRCFTVDEDGKERSTCVSAIFSCRNRSRKCGKRATSSRKREKEKNRLLMSFVFLLYSLHLALCVCVIVVALCDFIILFFLFLSNTKTSNRNRETSKTPAVSILTGITQMGLNTFLIRFSFLLLGPMMTTILINRIFFF